MLGRTNTFLLKSWFPSPTAATWNPTFPVHVEEGRDVTIKNSSSLKHRHMEKNFSLSRMVQHVLLKRQRKTWVPLPPLTWEAQHNARGHKVLWGQNEGSRNEWDAGAWRSGLVRTHAGQDCSSISHQVIPKQNMKSNRQLGLSSRILTCPKSGPLKIWVLWLCSYLDLVLQIFHCSPYLSLTKQIWEQLSLRSGVFWIS